MQLTDEQVAELWHRSYTAVDGLWFLKTEERYGFDAALDIDDEVWKVLPKIQARAIRSFGVIDPGIDGLHDCLATMLGLEGFAFEAERPAGGNGLRIVISRCPWHDAMVRSGRVDLSEKVGSRVCTTEYAAWASEFGNAVSFELGDRICGGCASCVLQFDSTP